MKFMWLAMYVWISPNYAHTQVHWEGQGQIVNHDLYATEGECISKAPIELGKSLRCVMVSFPDWETYE